MKKSNIFWIGYSDLMTSLFFVMLVLFVVTIGFLKYKIKTTEEELSKIQELQAAVQELPEAYFDYQPQYKRFKLKKHVQFDKQKSDIKPEYYDYLSEVGSSIKLLIDDLSGNPELSKLDIKYLVVIEGMASKDNYKLNYDLSYQRALSLYRFWESRNILFDPKSCEVQISGSGTGGIREYSGDEEYRNQQFLIHIIPKLGTVNEHAKSYITIEEKKEETIVKEENNEKMTVKEISSTNWEMKYDSVSEFGEDDIAIVRINEKFGFVNKEGKEIVQIIYENIDRSGERGLFIVVKDSKIGVINKFGDKIIPLKYDGIGEWSEGLAMVLSNDKCGYINISGVEVIPLSYDKCEKFNSGSAKVLYRGREIHIDVKNNLVGVVK